MLNGTADASAFREQVFAEVVDKRCIRTRAWKYIHYPRKPYGELYHLPDDPYELHNCYDAEPDVREEMTRLFYEQMDATEDFRHPKYQRFTGRHPETGEPVTHYLTW